MDFTYLDIAIGTIFIYLLLSLFASTIMELIATFFSFRADTLERGIKRMLNDSSKKTDLSKLFYDSSAIKYLGDTNLFGKDKKPSYLMPNNFSKSVLDIIVSQTTNKTLTLTDIQNGLNALKTKYPDSKVSVEYIESLLRDAGNDVDKFKTSLEGWFNDTMDRVNGWYKRTTQYWLLCIGFLIAIIINADTIHIIKYLNDNPKARTELADRAKVYINTHDAPSKSVADSAAQKNTLDTAIALLNRATKEQNNILEQGKGALGWPNGIREGLSTLCKDANESFIIKLIGFLLTALAISLGSSFWFDTLKKVISIRGAGENPDDSKSKQKQTT